MKFSIITPVYNGEKYIAETIESVLSQKGNFEIEYIITDGKSTDNTLNIIKHYEKLLTEKQYLIKCLAISYKWFSEKDNGMYSAINKGFSMATGNIYAWLNSDDLYMPGAMEIVSKTFFKYPDIKWIKGINAAINESSQIIKINPCYIYNQEWIQLGVYGRNAYFIHQESVFWRSELWKTTKGIDASLKLAGDYYLWTQFGKHSPLWSINAPLSCFRKRKHQLSENTGVYRKEQSFIIRTPKNWLVFRIKLFFWLKSKMPTFFEPVMLLLYRVLFRKRNKHYIDVKKNTEPTIKKAYSFIA
ncbi:glycosyltransferase [Patescibacteria group bacterium]|nr:glycosyltransferase [Patescibacteria group bacterium]